MKKSENSFIADQWDASPFVATVAFNSRETLPFSRGAPPDDMAASVGSKMQILHFKKRPDFMKKETTSSIESKINWKVKIWGRHARSKAASPSMKLFLTQQFLAL